MRPTDMRRAVAWLFILLVTAGSVAGATQIGKSASDFSLKNTAGKTVSLAHLKGKVVVLDFWATWCAPCMKELPLLEKLAHAVKASGKPVELLAINLDRDRKNVDRYLKAAQIRALHVLLDPQGAVAEKYDLATMPTSIVVDRQGIVRHVNAGYVPGDEKKLRAQIDALLK